MTWSKGRGSSYVTWRAAAGKLAGPLDPAEPQAASPPRGFPAICRCALRLEREGIPKVRKGPLRFSCAQKSQVTLFSAAVVTANLFSLHTPSVI
ncbi:hypothetical protein MC885_019213 [Smutsia gigantea]|nr:hypothetical protein MC885_019213 [Smutsia gigantea]